MSFTIISTDFPIIKTTSYPDVKINESFFRAMAINYSIIYPDGKTLEVTFKSAYMNTTAVIDQKIDRIKQQMQYLSNNKTISQKDQMVLNKYYESKLKSYQAKRTSIIENIHVEAEILDPNEK